VKRFINASMRALAWVLVWLVRKATAGGGENAVVAQNLLHLKQVNPSFNQMGGITVSAMSLET